MKALKPVYVAIIASLCCFALQGAENQELQAQEEMQKRLESAIAQQAADKHEYEQLRNKLSKQGKTKDYIDGVIEKKQQKKEWDRRERARKQAQDFFVNSLPCKSLKNGDLSSSTPLKEWTANSGTNEVCVTICTDSAQFGRSTVLAFREFRFSADGRLLAISSVKEIRRDGHNPVHNR